MVRGGCLVRGGVWSWGVVVSGSEGVVGSDHEGVWSWGGGLVLEGSVRGRIWSGGVSAGQVSPP